MAQNESDSNTSRLKILSPGYKLPWKNRLVICVGTIGALSAIATTVLLYLVEEEGWPSTHLRWPFVLWTVLPPVWLWAEYWLLWRHDGCTIETDALNKFKYGQDVGVKVWLAFATLLGSLNLLAMHSSQTPKYDSATFVVQQPAQQSQSMEPETGSAPSGQSSPRGR
ncbi:MAG: hypothetical protein NTY19_06575 [Planctomycetota bacterium]|nr:hypothetical protein [Planctomycetota bacterium]